MTNLSFLGFPYRLLVLSICAVLVFQPLQAHDWVQRPVTWGRAAVLAPLFAICLAVMFSQAAGKGGPIE